MLSGIFSDDWKCAKVTPLFKKGEASDLNNYGPISVISVRAKGFERTVDDQLYNFLSNEDIISTINSVFHSLHSTVTALLEVVDLFVAVAFPGFNFQFSIVFSFKTIANSNRQIRSPCADAANKFIRQPN